MTQASIVVPSRGGAKRLPVLFESLRRQTLDDVEMVVVIDGDIDDSESVVASYAAQLPVRSIVFPENRGRAAALNAGFGSADGDVLIRADDDLELEPDFVEHHVRLHRVAEQGVIAMCSDVFPPTPYARAYGIKADENIRAAAFAAEPNDTWQWWSGNVSTTRDDYERVGDYDESFRAYGWEDVEWGYRLHLLGRPIIIPKDFTTLHHGPVTSSAERAERAFASGAARLRFEEKHGHGILGDPDVGSGLWHNVVRAASLAMTDKNAVRAGRALDRSTDRLPLYVAEKLVALSIQSASRAGRRSSRRTISSVEAAVGEPR